MDASHRKRAGGFTRIELLCVITALTVIATLQLAGATGSRSQVQRAVDANNVRQILAATALYAANNDGALPHPGWGSIASSPGPDCWAYAGSNKGRLENQPFQIPAARGRTTKTNQLPFFKISLLGPLLKDDRVLECPKDIIDRRSGRSRALWIDRDLKLTAFTFNGAISGYGGRQHTAAVNGGTYKLSEFQPQDRMVWEANEQDPFNFSDGGSNPVNSFEGASRRHAGSVSSGPAIVGRFGGAVDYVPINSFRDFARSGGLGRPNELACGPGFR